MQQGRAPCIAYFESNCNTKPHASLLAELLVLCRGGDAAALTCFKQLFGPRIHVWMLFSVQERQATVKTLVDLLDVVGSTPLMCYVSARSLYTEGCFSLLRLANVHLVRELLLAVKDDIEKVSEEKMLAAELERRAGAVWSNWIPILQKCFGVLEENKQNVTCIKIARLLLVDMNGFRAFHPPIDSIESIGLFFSSLAKQLLHDKNYSDDSSFHRACWKLLNGALLGRVVPNSFVSLIQHICTAFLPLLSRRPVARFLGCAFDHPDLRSFLADRVLPQFIENVTDELAKQLAVKDVVEGGSDWLSTLSDDFCSEDECSFLAIVIGRAFTQPFAKVIKNRVDRISSFSASQRAAYYSLLECVPVKPFVLVESILHFEIKAWNKDHSLLLWPVFRSCCKLIESCAFSCVEMRQFDVSFEFLVFVLSERAMNVVCRVHAALAMRGLIEWQRVEQTSHVCNRLSSSSALLCSAVVDLFRCIYEEQVLEDDLAEGVLLQLLPLQAEMVSWAAPADVLHVASNIILGGVVQLWRLDVPSLVRIQLLRTVEETLLTLFSILPSTPCLLPALQDLVTDAFRRGVAEAGAGVLVLAALSHSAADCNAALRSLVFSLCSQRWSLTQMMDEPTLPSVLEMQHKGAALPDAGRLVQLLCSMPHTPKVAEALKLIRP